MSAADNLALLLRWNVTENDHDLDAAAEIHAGCEFHFVGRGRVLTSREYGELMRMYFAGLPDYHARLDDVFATDDRAVSRWTITGTHSGELWGAPPTGRRIELKGASIVEFAGGRPSRFWVYSDPASLQAQLHP